MKTGLVAIDGTRRVHIAALTSRAIAAFHEAMRNRSADECIRGAIEVRTIVTKVPLNSEYPKIFIIFPF